MRNALIIGIAAIIVVAVIVFGTSYMGNDADTTAENLGDATEESARDFGQGVEETAEDAGSALGEAMEDTGQAIGDAAEETQGAFEGGGDQVGETADGLDNNVENEPVTGERTLEDTENR